MKFSAFLLLAICVLISGFIHGCRKNFTRQRYETIYTGMQDREVLDILGEPNGKNAQSWWYEGKQPYYKAIIQFENSRVKDKSWSWSRPRQTPIP